MANVTTIDFETYGIENRPDYPPKPTGLAIRWPSKKKEYLCFAHPWDRNNSNWNHVKNALSAIWDSNTKILCHNAAFDLEVVKEHFGLPWPSSDRIEDTLVLAYLHDPRVKSLSLKPLAQSYLHEPPEERDLLFDWIQNRIFITPHGPKIDSLAGSGKKIPKSKLGKYITYGSAELLAKYAIGDVKRTYKLYKFFKKSNVIPFDWYRSVEIPMLEIKILMEKKGIKLDTDNLIAMRNAFEKARQGTMLKIQRITGENLGNFNLNSPAQLALLIEPFMLAWDLTPKGKRSTSMLSLTKNMTHKGLLRALQEHSVLNHYLAGFINPWLSRDTSRLYTTFHTTRGDDSTGGYGTRSGRFSSSNPNLENIATNPEESTNSSVLMRIQKKLRHDYNFRGLRDMFLPEPGQLLLSTDYKQQELRILAHFAKGPLVKAYNHDPNLNFHQFIGDLVNTRDTNIPHKAVKIVVFMSLYGAGIGKIAEALNMSYQSAKELKEKIWNAMPGVSELNKRIKETGEITTWGGRHYTTEPARFVNGEWRTFEYKLLNLLIQGSAADATKQAMVQLHRANLEDFTMQLQEHDEIVGSFTDLKTARTVKECMETLSFKVPMLTDQKTGTTWAQMR